MLLERCFQLSLGEQCRPILERVQVEELVVSPALQSNPVPTVSVLDGAQALVQILNAQGYRNCIGFRSGVLTEFCATFDGLLTEFFFLDLAQNRGFFSLFASLPEKIAQNCSKQGLFGGLFEASSGPLLGLLWASGALFSLGASSEPFLSFWTSSQPFLGLGASSVLFVGFFTSSQPFLGFCVSSEPFLGFGGPFVGFWASFQPFLGPRGLF